MAQFSRTNPPKPQNRRGGRKPSAATIAKGQAAEMDRQQKAFDVFENSASGNFCGFDFVDVFHKHYDKQNAIFAAESDDRANVATPWGVVHVGADGVMCYFFSEQPTKTVTFNRSIYFFSGEDRKLKNTQDFEKMAADYEQAKAQGKVLPAECWDDIKNATEQEAAAKAFAKIEFCDGDYIGYFCATQPWYEFGLLVFDGETHRKIYDDLQIHHTAYINRETKEIRDATTAESIEAIIKQAKNHLFTVAQLAEPLKSHYEYEQKQDFIINHYANRYARIYAGYIGSPSAEQVKAAQNWYYENATMHYYENADDARAVRHMLHRLAELRRETLNSYEYLKEALKGEFYNYECMYAERYDEAAEAVGVDVNDMTETQTKAYNAAYKEFWKEVNAREDW